MALTWDAPSAQVLRSSYLPVFYAALVKSWRAVKEYFKSKLSLWPIDMAKNGECGEQYIDWWDLPRSKDFLPSSSSLFASRECKSRQKRWSGLRFLESFNLHNFERFWWNRNRFCTVSRCDWISWKTKTKAVLPIISDFLVLLYYCCYHHEDKQW